MTVKELKRRLEAMDDNMQIVVAHDAEGNEFSPLNDVGTGEYHQFFVLVNNDRRSKKQVPKDVVVLWPE